MPTPHSRRLAVAVVALITATGLAPPSPVADAAPHRKPPTKSMTLTASPTTLTGNELRCLPTSFTATMTNTSDKAFFADTTLAAEAPIELSTEVFSSYLPATDPDQPVSREVAVTVPRGTDSGTYDITLRSGPERVVIPLTVSTVPEPEPGDNLAYAQQVTASSTHGSFSTCAAVDGNRDNDDWEGTGWNDADREVFPDWLAVNWPAAVPLAEVVVITRGSPGEPAAQGIKDFDVQVQDGTEWVTVCPVRENLDTRISCALPATTETAAIRVLVHASNSDDYSRILEVEAYGPS